MERDALLRDRHGQDECEQPQRGEWAGGPSPGPLGRLHPKWRRSMCVRHLFSEIWLWSDTIIVASVFRGTIWFESKYRLKGPFSINPLSGTKGHIDETG